MLYYFLLGSTPNLSLAELKSVYPDLTFDEISSNLYLSDIKGEFIPSDEMQKLGGTIKIGKIINTLKDKNLIKSKIVDILIDAADKKKIIFGISRYGSAPIDNIKAFPKDIKKILEKKNYNVRFILPTEAEALTSVQVEKYKINEIIVARKDKDIYIGQTLVVQDFTAWGKRDYKRPFADPKIGMLPPKIARIMVNLALFNFFRLKSADKSPIVFDPFCGMGTIGAEALMRGSWAIINDIEKNTLEKAEKNLQWLCRNYDINPQNYQIYNADARFVSGFIPENSVDAIVTEPYLGPPVNFYKNKPMINDRPITEGRILFFFNELEKLYTACFENWKNILRPDALVVMIIPSYRIENCDYFMKNIIDTCEKLGYNVIDGPFDYGHPQAIVRRNIYVFQKK